MARVTGKPLSQIHACFSVFARQVRDRIAKAIESGKPIETTDDVDGMAYAAVMTVSMMRQKHLGAEKDIRAELAEAQAIFESLTESFALLSKEPN